MHEHSEHSPWRTALYPALVAAALLLRWLGPWQSVAGIDLAAVIAVVGGWRIFYIAIENLLKLRISGDLPVAIAAVGAIAIGENLAAAEVILIMLIGEALEEFAVGRTQDAIKRLASVIPQTARLKTDDGEREVPVAEVPMGALVIVRPGERIAVDGEVSAGSSDVDESAFTGEPLHAPKHPGDKVLTGTINVSGALTVRAESVGEDTTLGRIIHLMQHVEEEKAPAERRADRYATYFVPIVLVLATVAFLVTKSTTNAIAVLVVACPCSLVLAAPTAIVAGIGRLARSGVLVKRGAALEAVGRTQCVVFDKTGTLTTGQPQVGDAASFGMPIDEALRLAACAEALSEHMVGSAIRGEAQRRGIAFQHPDEFQPLPGLGVQAAIEGKRVLVGRPELLEREGVDLSAEVRQEAERLRESGQSIALVAVDGAAVATIGLRDTVRDDAARTVSLLREAGVGRIVMLTGDNEQAARAIGQQVGIDEIAAGLLPDEKIAHIRRLQSEGLQPVMIGDGVNDAPALAAADVGIGIGDVGTDIAAEAADIVLMTGDLTRLSELILVSRRALKTIDQNIRFFAFAFNGAGVIVAGAGIVTPVIAAWLHQVGSLMVILNSLRLLGSARSGARRVLGWLGRQSGAAGALLILHRAAIIRWLPVVLLGAYALSGAYQVNPGEAAVVRIFGRVIPGTHGPGLHYRPPWPVGKTVIVKTDMVRPVEIGFRTGANAAASQPDVYEWNTQHRAGGYQKIFEEAIMLTGDANLLHVSLVVQYKVTDPAQYTLHVENPDLLIRCLCEHATRCAINATDMTSALTGGRRKIEERIGAEAQRIARRYQCGIEIVRVGFQDVHPPLEVVDAFREVSSEAEQKQRRINEAEAYAIEQVKLSSGEARKVTEEAKAYAADRVIRAKGESQRFTKRREALQTGPKVERTRLHLQAVDESLAAPRKLILDRREVQRRQLLFVGPKGLQLSLPEGTALPVQPAQTDANQ